MSDGDIMSAIRQVAAERKIEPEEIIDAIKASVLVMYEKEYKRDEQESNLSVEFDPEQGHMAIYAEKSVVKKVEDERFEISVKEAKEYDDSVKVGETLLIDVTPEGDFGRIAAQAARQVMFQKLRESEKTAAINEVRDRIGSIDDVSVQRVIRDGDVVCELNRARAVMPADERVMTEFYQLGSRIKVLLKSIEEDSRGQYILISRSDPDFLQELFRLEVPEIDSETIEIVRIARDAGSRSKVAVKSNASGIDPIGSCVGQKGVRINAIMNELKLGRFEEKIDIILWEEDNTSFIKNAMQPAEVMGVKLDEENKKAIVFVHPEQHSLAIGREGQNARLAARLTGWDIDVQEDEEARAALDAKLAAEAEAAQDAETAEEGEQVDVEANDTTTAVDDTQADVEE